MNLTTIGRVVRARLRTTCGLFLLIAATAAAVEAGGPVPHAVPEIDPGSMSGALAMLASGAFLVKGRLCRR